MLADQLEPDATPDSSAELPSMVDLSALEEDLNDIDLTLAELQD